MHVGKCGARSTIADLEEVFRSELKNRFADGGKMAGHIVQAEQNLKDQEAWIAAHQQAIQEIEAEMKNMLRLSAEGQITPPGFGKFYKPAEERLNQLTAKLPKLQAEVDYLKINKISAEDVMQEANTLYDRWPQLALDDRRKIAEALCEKVVIGKGEIDITYSFLPTSEELCKNTARL
jgi:site-specific DNA recombinase